MGAESRLNRQRKAVHSPMTHEAQQHRCHICGAEMSHMNNEICKNFHVQKPHTSTRAPDKSEQHPHGRFKVLSDEEWKEYEKAIDHASHSTPVSEGYLLITPEELQHLIDGYVYDNHETAKNINKLVKSRPTPAPTDEQWRKEVAKFTEEDPLLMAYVEGQKAGRAEATAAVLNDLHDGGWLNDLDTAKEYLKSLRSHP